MVEFKWFKFFFYFNIKIRIILICFGKFLFVWLVCELYEFLFF